MKKKIATGKPKEIKVAALYSSESAQSAAAPGTWLKENRELLAIFITIFLTLLGLFYEMGSVESELREKINASNTNISQLQKEVEYLNQKINDMNREIGEYQAAITFLKERQ